MKKQIIVLASALLMAGVQAQETTIKEDISSAISDVFSIGKETISGVVDGLEKGRSDKEQEKFTSVSDKASLNQFVKLKGYRLEALDNGHLRLTIAIMNESDQDIRITGLSSIRSLILIDVEGFAVPLDVNKEARKDIFVFERSATKAVYVFKNTGIAPKTLRFLGVDIALPAITDGEKQ